MTSKPKSYRAGDFVWVNCAGPSAHDVLGFHEQNRRATLTSAAHLVAAGLAVDLRYDDDGRNATVAVADILHDTPEFRAWREAYETHAENIRVLHEACVVRGVTFGSPACQKLPEWRTYVAVRDRVSRLGRAAFAAD